MNSPLFSTQNTRRAFYIYDCLAATKKHNGQSRPNPHLRFEMCKKNELEPGRYTIDRQSTLSHNLPLSQARLLCYDLANFNFMQDDYHTFFSNDATYPTESDKVKARMLSVTYQPYKEQNEPRIIFEIWDGPGHKQYQGWAIDDREKYSLAILIPLASARAMALDVLARMQSWDIITTLATHQNKSTEQLSFADLP